MADRDSQITFQSQNTGEQLIGSVQITQLDAAEKKNSKQKTRLNSLDILRGITMMGMIIVDCRGPHAPWFIKHVAWNGLSPADFVFPSFVFIMGMAVPLAINKNNPIKIKNIIRIIALFLIGFLLNLFDNKFDFSTVRILGILQRLSICYLLVVIIHCVTKYGEKSYRFIGSLLTICIGLVYLSLMLTFQNESIGCTRQKNLTQFCNFGSYLDRKIFSKNHMLSDNDPEGLFTNLSAFLNGYIGYRYTLLMMDHKGNTNKILTLWALFAVLLGTMVYPLTILMPLNKKIWSISFVFLTASASGLILTFITFFVDVLGKRYEKYNKVISIIIKPSIWLGRNPLAVFVAMQFVASLLTQYIVVNDKSAAQLFYHYIFQSWIKNPEIASTIFPIFFLLIWTIMAAILFKFSIFIRL